MTVRFPRISPSWVIGTLALVLAASSGAYAAGLAADSVGTRQLKDGAVTTAKVRNGSLQKKDLRAGILIAGPEGPPGQTGPAGPVGSPGTARGLARIQWNGVVLASNMTLDDITVTHPATGTYCIFGTVRVANDAWLGSIAPNGVGPTETGFVAVDDWGVTIHCPHDAVRVQTYLLDGTPADKNFTIAML